MSTQRLSTATVLKVKGVSLNYLQFLWTNIQDVRKVHAQGEYAAALEKITQFIPYLPDSMKDKHADRAGQIQLVMMNIQSDAYPFLKEIPDFFQRGIMRFKLLQNYSRLALEKFISEMTTDLNNLGYMENIKEVEQGDVDLPPEWLKKKIREQKEAAEEEQEQSDYEQGRMDENIE